MLHFTSSNELRQDGGEGGNSRQPQIPYELTGHSLLVQFPAVVSPLEPRLQKGREWPPWSFVLGSWRAVLVGSGLCPEGRSENRVL